MNICFLGLLWSHISSAQPGGMMFSVEVGSATQMTVARSLEFTGSIEPWRDIDLAAEIPGRVTRIPIEEGQVLKGGDLVCELDTEAIRIQLERNRANMKSSLAELRKMESGFRQEEIEEAGRIVDSWEARFKKALDDWNRQKPLVEKGVVSQSEGTRIELTVLEMEANLYSARAKYNLIKRGFRTEEIEKARADYELSLADLADASRQLTHHQVFAPMDCVVVKRLKEPGEWVVEGEAVARLVVQDLLKVRFEVPQVYLPLLQPGQQTRIEVDGFPGKRFQAEVERIVPAAGQTTRNFPVFMRLENNQGELTSGLFARVYVKIGEQVETIVVPREAILIRGDIQVVLVADPIPAGPPAGTEIPVNPPANPPAGPPTGGPPSMEMPQPDAVIREVEVRTGTEVDQGVAVEVIKGDPIKPGDQVVILGGNRLSGGMPVRIIRNSPSASNPADRKNP